MRIEYRSKEEDSLRRCVFLLHWMADYHPGHPLGEYRIAERGQYYFADPHKYGFPRLRDVLPKSERLQNP